MARIRSIKPEFYTDGDVMDMSPSARLMFIGTWNFAMCDFGHVPDDARRLKMQILPADEVMLQLVDDVWTVQPIDAEVLLEEIIASGRIDRIEVGGRSFLHIRRFTDHQKTEKRWSPRCAACQASQELAGPPETSPNLSETPPTSPQEGKGRERKGKAAAAAAGATNAAAAALPASIDILRSKLQAHTPLRALRFDSLDTDRTTQLADLIATHGDTTLVDTAIRTLRSPPPVHVTAFLGTWAALPAPGQRLAAVKEPECSDHPGKPARTCSGCAADRLVGDRA